jgi:hypothetical protein
MKSKEVKKEEPQASSTGLLMAVVTCCVLPPLAAICATLPAKHPIVGKIYPALVVAYCVGVGAAARFGSTA